MSLYAVIIAGGRGKRFWPKSRMDRPKYLLSFFGSKTTLIQQAVSRLQGIVDNKNILIITNKLQAKEVRKQLPRIPQSNIIPEPESKNTAAAIGLASVIINTRDPSAVFIVLPADQLILDNDKFRAAIKTAAEYACLGNAVVTIGIKPTFASTGFGYIKTGKNIENNIFRADAFVEKPDAKRAKQFLKSGNYFWNGGIFISKASVMMEEINKCAPKLSLGLKFIKMYAGTNKFDKAIARHYKGFDDISIDYAVMEKSKRVCVVKTNFKLYDIGSWKNIAEIMKHKARNNIVMGSHESVGTKSCIIVSNDEHLVGTVGLRDIIIIHTDDATLVCRKDKSELVKNLVEKIEKNKPLRKFL
ncbi:MAG: mannose-1-phosphate guanylyltransferase [Candidatus Omnitrophica bacterium]|nr:mannose-1-phosphate guanylyltransferase [Candidatus Omnitrophota bacterium]